MMLFRAARSTRPSLLPLLCDGRRTLASVAASNVTRITDPSRQPGTAKDPPRRRSQDNPMDFSNIPEVTPEQQQAAMMKKKADEEAIAAKAAASEAAIVAAALRKVADEYELLKKKADERASTAHKAVEEAALAKRKADEKALEFMKTTAAQEKSFLQKAFKNFDTKSVGYLTPDQMQTVLKALKLPAESGDVDDIVQVLDIRKDEVVHSSAWVNHMPDEMKQALRNHPQASEWAN